MNILVFNFIYKLKHTITPRQFVHERYAKKCPAEERRLLGWWGHRLSTRFQMSNRMELAEGAAGFRLSTPSPILMVESFLKCIFWLQINL
jgi:kynureninase